MNTMTKMLEVTISGNYKTANNDIVEFEDLKGVIPFTDDEHAAMHVRRRYAVPWVKAALKKDGEKLYPARVEKMRQVWIDDIKEVKGKLSFAGKDIKEMSYEELQDLATAKDIRLIPLPKEVSGMSLREARTRAYAGYSEIVLNETIDFRASGFNFAKLPPLVVGDTNSRIEKSEKLTNDEVIEAEINNPDPVSKVGSKLTLEELKALADSKNIKYHHNIGFDKLHAKLYG
jgi:hypothetical protein